MSDLPPLEQPQAYVVVGPDDQRGPYTLELLISEVVAGRLNEATPVWWPGLADWTTLSAHPSVAAEVQRRRNPAPAPGPAAFSPQAPTPQAPEPQAPEPQPYAQPSAHAPGQYEEAEYPYAQPGAGVAAESSPGQDYSTDAYAGGRAMPAEPDMNQVVDVPAVEVTPADFAAVDEQIEGFRAAGPAEGLDPEHGMAFAELIRRSRARADAASIVQALDATFTDAVGVAAGAQGLEPVGREELTDRHLLSFKAPDGASVEVSMSRVTGHAMAVREGHVDLDVSCSSSSYTGDLDAGSGEHGEIVVRAAQYGGSTIAAVSLMLPLADYVSENLDADEAALRRDLEAVIASVRHRLS